MHIRIEDLDFGIEFQIDNHILKLDNIFKTATIETLGIEIKGFRFLEGLNQGQVNFLKNMIWAEIGTLIPSAIARIAVETGHLTTGTAIFGAGLMIPLLTFVTNLVNINLNTQELGEALYLLMYLHVYQFALSLGQWLGDSTIARILTFSIITFLFDAVIGIQENQNSLSHKFFPNLNQNVNGDYVEDTLFLASIISALKSGILFFDIRKPKEIADISSLADGYVRGQSYTERYGSNMNTEIAKERYTAVESYENAEKANQEADQFNNKLKRNKMKMVQLMGIQTLYHFVMFLGTIIFLSLNFS